MAGDNAEILILRPRRLKLALYGVLSAAFTVGGVLMILDNDKGGWFVSAFFGLCTLVFIGLLMPGSASLTLTREGFHVRSLWRGGFTAWSEVERFGVARLGHRTMVTYDLLDAAGRRKGGYVRRLTGVEAALPDTYGMPAENLARLMNAWRERALGAPVDTEK